MTTFARRVLLCVFAAVLAGGAGASAQTTAPARPPASTTRPSDGNRRAHADWYAECERRVAAFKDKPCDVLFVGDSITQGWTADPTPKWDLVGGPVWRERYADRRALNFGVGADKTQDVLWRLDNMDVAALRPKVVVILIGTNNTASPPADVAAGVGAVLDKTRAMYPASKTIVVSVLPNARGRDKFDAVNRLIASLADDRAVFYLDLAAKMPKQGDSWLGLGRDRLHLSEAGYTLWANEMEPLLTRLLAE